MGAGIKATREQNYRNCGETIAFSLSTAPLLTTGRKPSIIATLLKPVQELKTYAKDENSQSNGKAFSCKESEKTSQRNENHPSDEMYRWSRPL